jgi:hypothetical protein
MCTQKFEPSSYKYRNQPCETPQLNV